MPPRILTLLLLSLAMLAAPAQARVMTASIAKVTTGVATMHEVRVRLEWPADAASGQLLLQARRVRAPDLGYDFENVEWQCTLQRAWRCAGGIHSAGRKPLRLDVDLATASTDAILSGGNAALSVHRIAATPDLTRVDLTRVPVAWAQALVAQAWPEATLTAGQLSGSLAVGVPKNGPVNVRGRLDLLSLGLDTPDGRIAAQDLRARLDLDYRKFPGRTLVTVEGDIDAGEILLGSGYFELGGTPTHVNVAALKRDGGGWQVPRLAWSDGGTLRVDGSLAFDVGATPQSADLRITSADLGRVGPRYLSGWLGLLGLGEMVLEGTLDAHVLLQEGALARAEATLGGVSITDAQQRFGFDGVEGDIVFSDGAVAESQLRWTGGRVAGVSFGPAEMPLQSGGGSISLRRKVGLPLLGGSVVLESLEVRPPLAGRGLEVEFGLALQSLDVGQLAAALDWPAFTGRLDGRVPSARYADDRMSFDGTLTAQTFGGTVEVSGLAMERPFGPAPTLVADIVFEDMDLQALTGVFGFGEITGALDGSVRGLRLVDWSAQAFDARLRTDDAWKGRRRISQRAVQDLSSVGGAGGLGNSLQAQVLKLFDDFGYRRIGISCRLANEVCVMDGLGSVGAGFSIVQGSGLPHLSVVGFNRRVDWPVLVERLVAVTQGESTPIIE